ncbi:MAG: hypothetical protein PW788_02180 [Micavibrio sp.]|nr:hypothetical protein [Micavibrio sp.]
MSSPAFIPGGWIGYGAYRVAKYRYSHKATNDDTAQNPPVPEAAKPESPDQKSVSRKRLCPLSPRKPKL